MTNQQSQKPPNLKKLVKGGKRVLDSLPDAPPALPNDQAQLGDALVQPLAAAATQVFPCVAPAAHEFTLENLVSNTAAVAALYHIEPPVPQPQSPRAQPLDPVQQAIHDKLNEFITACLYLPGTDCSITRHPLQSSGGS